MIGVLVYVMDENGNTITDRLVDVEWRRDRPFLFPVEAFQVIDDGADPA
ncbi:hypothetical protein [Geotalea toluenoxydans]|nr:hypothetical protein [Geotalea toluenoxydans]